MKSVMKSEEYTGKTIKKFKSKLNNISKDTVASISSENAEDLTRSGIDYRKYSLSKKETRKWFLLSAPSFALLGYLFYHSLIVALVFSLLSVPLKKYYADHLGSKRRDGLAAQFRDLLASLSASFATGRLMTEALSEAEESLGLIYDKNDPILIELNVINKRLGQGREREQEVLFDFADRSADPEIAGFVDVYFTCLTTGADQVSAVARASELIMEKLEMKKELKTLTAQKKLEGKILALLPPVILAFLSLTSPDYISLLYDTAGGLFIMTISLILIGIAFHWSNKITDIRL